jgi:hypothetical protein
LTFPFFLYIQPDRQRDRDEQGAAQGKTRPRRTRRAAWPAGLRCFFGNFDQPETGYCGSG